MRRHVLSAITAVAALGAVAVAAPAQQAGRVRASRTPGFTYIIRGDSGTVTYTDARRGRIGITVSLAPDRGRDSIGAYVQEVADNGPADRAGMRAGDLIVRWNDIRLAEGASRDHDGEFRSRPGQRLINLAQRLEPGDTVRLEVRRESRSMQFSVVADSADLDRIITRLPPGIIRERMPFLEGEMLPSAGPRLRVMAFDGFGDLELVRVSPPMAENLGLGVSEGLLVVDIDSASTLGLRAGDVVLTIGGRRATSPEHAMRILSTYERDEQIQFEVQRQRRRQTVTGRLPEARRGFRAIPNSFMPSLEMEPLHRFELELEPMLRQFRELEAQQARRRSVQTE